MRVLTPRLPTTLRSRDSLDLLTGNEHIVFHVILVTLSFCITLQTYIFLKKFNLSKSLLFVKIDYNILIFFWTASICWLYLQIHRMGGSTEVEGTLRQDITFECVCLLNMV